MMYTVETEKEAVFVTNDEFVALPKGTHTHGDLKLYRTHDEEKAESIARYMGCEFEVVKE